MHYAGFIIARGLARSACGARFIRWKTELSQMVDGQYTTDISYPNHYINFHINTHC